MAVVAHIDGTGGAGASILQRFLGLVGAGGAIAIGGAIADYASDKAKQNEAGKDSSVPNLTPVLPAKPENKVEVKPPIVTPFKPVIKEDITTPKVTPDKPEEPKKDPIPEKITPSIKDDSTNNVETPINGIDYAWLEKDRNERWEREDQIRKETQEREDTAYQRAVKDAWASGINPNLMNVQPASSGGGITQAQGINPALGSLSQNEYLLELEKELDQAFKGDQNEKDRIKDLIANLLMIFAFAGRKKP